MHTRAGARALRGRHAESERGRQQTITDVGYVAATCRTDTGQSAVDGRRGDRVLATGPDVVDVHVAIQGKSSISVLSGEVHRPCRQRQCGQQQAGRQNPRSVPSLA